MLEVNGNNIFFPSYHRGKKNSADRYGGQFNSEKLRFLCLECKHKINFHLITVCWIYMCKGLSVSATALHFLRSLYTHFNCE